MKTKIPEERNQIIHLKLKITTMPMDWFYQYYENDYTIKIYSVPFYPYQNYNEIHCNNRKFNHKIHKNTRPQLTKAILNKKSNFGGIPILGSKVYYRVIKIKAP
jgi:hypothetical protein